MQIKWLPKGSSIVSEWSGGKTRQVAICPEDASYQNRAFIWRVSSASVDVPESDFTLLPDYDRVLLVLQGAVRLKWADGSAALRELEQTTFDGGAHTKSFGVITDFNLMHRKGTDGDVCVVAPGQAQVVTQSPRQGFSKKSLIVYAHCEASSILGRTLSRGDAVLITSENSEPVCVAASGGALVCARVRHN